MTRVVYVVEVDKKPMGLYFTRGSAVDDRESIHSYGRSAKVVRYVPAAKKRKVKR